MTVAVDLIHSLSLMQWERWERERWDPPRDVFLATGHAWRRCAADCIREDDGVIEILVPRDGPYDHVKVAWSRVIKSEFKWTVALAGNIVALQLTAANGKDRLIRGKLKDPNIDLVIPQLFCVSGNAQSPETVCFERLQNPEVLLSDA